ncbi:BBE domain-containing protein [Streptomyces thermolilacinus]|uniref:BBE domain-containing protein n=1 Tax=Streptomyces thermolilacinus TaxID=285540 RepID=UPI0033CF1C9B
MRTHPAPACTTFFLSWPWARAAAVVREWQRWAPTAPDGVGAGGRPSRGGAGRRPGPHGPGRPGEPDRPARRPDRRGAPFGLGAHPPVHGRDEGDGRGVRLDGPRGAPERHAAGPRPARAGGARVVRGPLRLLHAARPADGGAGADRAGGAAGAAVHGRRGQCGAGRHGRRGQPGAAGRHGVRPPERAVPGAVHRLLAGPGPVRHGGRHRAWLDGTYDTMRPWASGQAYQNYTDPALRDWRRAYYGANSGRLAKVKAAYDPERLFRHPHSF